MLNELGLTTFPAKARWPGVLLRTLSAVKLMTFGGFLLASFRRDAFPTDDIAGLLIITVILAVAEMIVRQRMPAPLAGARNG